MAQNFRRYTSNNVGTVAATIYTGDGSALTGIGGDMDITSSLFV